MGMPLFHKDKMSAEERAQALMEGKPVDRVPFAILAYPFLRSRWASLVAGIVVIGLGVYVNGLKSPSPWLLWLGVQQVGRYMVDFYPLLPWFGIALLGVFVGLTLYPGGTPRFALPDLTQRTPIRGLTFLGKHSLLIYLIHQPILFAILILVGIGSI